MKTTLKKILAIGLMLPSLFLTACGKDGGSSSTTTTTTTGYYWGTNGTCYANGTTTPVASTLCTTTTGYQMINNLCYQTSTNTVVNQSLCYNSGTNNAGSCYGLYRWNSYTVQCNGADCRGYTLINLTTGQSQVCY